MERKYFVIAILWVAVITFLSLNSLSGAPSINIPNKDKVVHFIFYFVFVFIWYKAFLDRQKYLIAITICAIIYGIIIEILQNTVTLNRSADILDVVANATGALTAFYAVRLKIIL